MSKLITVPNFDLGKITYSDPKSMGSSGGNSGMSKQIYVNYEGSSIMLPTPVMRIPFGLGKYQPDKSIPAKYTLNLAFDGMDKDPQLKEFFTKIMEFENKIKEDAKNNSIAWLNKMVDDTMDKNFTSCLKYSKDKDTGKQSTKYAPTMQIKVPYFNRKFGMTVFDENTQEINVDDNCVPKGCYAIAIIKCSGIWTSSHGYGCTWKLEQLKLENKNTTPQTHQNNQNNQTNQNNQVKTSVKQTYAFIDDE